MRIAAVVWLWPALAFAEPTTGRLAVSVRDAGGTAIPQVRVVVEGNEVARTAWTGGEGTVTVDHLLPGLYRVSASAQEFRSAETSVNIAADRLAVADMRLASSPHLPVAGSTYAFMDGVPLWSRSSQAALRLGLAARARAGAQSRSAGGYDDPEWTLGGLEFTDPRTGAPLLPLGLAGVASLSVDEVAARVGPLAEILSVTGSNRSAAVASYQAGSAGTHLAEALASGPVLKDHLWYAVSGQVAAWPRGGAVKPTEQGLAKVTWQALPRHKLTLFGAGAAGAPEVASAAFAGVSWEALATDALVLTTTASTFQGGSLRVRSAATRAEYFVDRGSGDHELSLEGRFSDISDGERWRRGRLRIGDGWKPGRHFAVDAYYTADTAERARPGSGGGLSLIWDATQDGRTAVRVRARTALVPGLVAPAGCADCRRATRLDEVALGIEREIPGAVPVGAELLHRRARAYSPAGAITRDHESLLALHFKRGRSRYPVSVLYVARLTDRLRHELTLLAGLGVVSRLSISALVLHAPRSSWAPLFDETRSLDLAPGPDSSAWLLAAQVHLELGHLTGFRSAVWLDALNLTGDRGRLSTASRPLRVPPFQVRLGVRAQY